MPKTGLGRALCAAAPMVRLCAVIAALWVSPAFADTVTPTADVTNRVIVRAGPSAQSAQVGTIEPGQQATLLGSVPNWFEVRLSTGVHGFVSKRWVRVIAAAAPPSVAATPTPTFTVHVFDVGTGLAILVQGPDFALVFDGGSNDDVARGADNRMVAYLKAVAPALTTIDHLILSHPHRDHVELLPDVLAAYRVRQVWDSGRLNDICGYRAFLTAVRDEPGVQYHNALQAFGTAKYTFAGKRCYGVNLPAETIQIPLGSRIDNAPIALGANAAMTILHADGEAHGSPNENSIVVRLDLGTVRVLLMGDAEAGGRKAPGVAPTTASIEGVLLSCCTSDLKADVLVAGHHGSLTSSRKAFIEAVGASVFVISSGPLPYGEGDVVLPDAAIVAELKAHGQLFRTDQDDAGCRTRTSKIGPDADQQPGGCTAIRLLLGGTPAIQPSVFAGAD